MRLRKQKKQSEQVPTKPKIVKKKVVKVKTNDYQNSSLKDRVKDELIIKLKKDVAKGKELVKEGLRKIEENERLMKKAKMMIDAKITNQFDLLIDKNKLINWVGTLTEKEYPNQKATIRRIKKTSSSNWTLTQGIELFIMYCKINKLSV